MSIDASGITIKRLADLVTDIGEGLRANVSPDINLSPDSVMGKIVGVFAAELSLVYELAQQGYDSIDPDQAEGRQLDNIGALRGIGRNAGTYTTATVILNASSAITIDAGDLTVETENGIQLTNQGDIALASTVLITGSLNFVGGSTRTVTRSAGSWSNDGVVAGSKVTFASTLSNNYTATVASVESATALTLTSAAVVTNETAATPLTTVYSASALFAAGEVGPKVALASAVNTISTPITGLNSVVNPADATPGSNVESDLEYRVRQEASLQQTGAGVDYAIRAALLDIDTVDQAFVYSNRTDATVDGIPPHAFECVIWPDVGDDVEIASAIFLKQPAGIQAYGTTVLTVTDSQGEDQLVGFSYASALSMYVKATITTDASYPADGDDQVAAALLAEGNSLSVGDDVKIWKFLAALDSIPGIVTVSVAIETSPSPTSTSNIAIARGQIATFDSSRVEVVSS